MTRDRAAAIERAVGTYRRTFEVPLHQTAAEMMADLITWHKLYVDDTVDVHKLFMTAERRANVADADRESQVRGEEAEQAPVDPDLPTVAQLLTASPSLEDVAAFWASVTDSTEVNDARQAVISNLSTVDEEDDSA